MAARFDVHTPTVRALARRFERTGSDAGFALSASATAAALSSEAFGRLPVGAAAATAYAGRLASVGQNLDRLKAALARTAANLSVTADNYERADLESTF
ncbi:MAG: type VII secretion target [Candidatus Dormibacteraeota bacterium]|nr:type VII secretion target [Candidatus Dormibacteraeota bacterium]